MCKATNHHNGKGQSNSLATQAFIRAVADLAIARLNAEDKEQASRCVITYGAGKPNLRGVTYYDAWKQGDQAMAFVEVCAMGQSDAVQLAGTTVHEIGHVLAGYDAGHGKQWKDACARLGLRRIKAAGTVYNLSNFDPAIREQVYRLILQLEQAEPTFARGAVGIGKGKIAVKPAACPAGIGTQGGTSRGKGSGSRMLKLSCNDCQAVWRMAGKWAASATACPCCQSSDIEKPDAE